jgi:hypothetical protein
MRRTGTAIQRHPSARAAGCAANKRAAAANAPLSIVAAMMHDAIDSQRVK